MYFSTGAELCYKLEYHIKTAKDNGFNVVELFEAVPDSVPGFFFCQAALECSEEGACGKSCLDYAPKNGKSGMCRHKKGFYSPGKLLKFDVQTQKKIATYEGAGKSR